MDHDLMDLPIEGKIEKSMSDYLFESENLSHFKSPLRDSKGILLEKMI